VSFSGRPKNVARFRPAEIGVEKRLAGTLLHASDQKYGGLVRGAPVMKKQGRIEGSGDAFGIGKQMLPFLPAVGVVQPICPIH
jgi:hypothetical protein